MPTAIPPLAVIQAVPARQAGSGGVNTQRRGPRGKIQVLQIPELVVMQQHCSALLSHGCLPPGKLLCGSAARYLTALSRYWRTHATLLCNTHTSAFKADTTSSTQGRIKQSTSYLTLHTPCLIICPRTNPGVRKVEPKNEQVFATRERKNQPTTNSLRSAEKWNFPASQLLNPHVFISFYFGVSSSPFLQDMVKFSHFPSQCLVCCHSCHSCHVPPHTRLWQRREEQLLSTRIHSAKCVRVSVIKSTRSISWVIFVSVINVTWRERCLESTKTLLQHLFVNKLQNPLGKVYSNT